MNSIRSLWNALGNLAASINALAGVVDVAAGRLRQQLALDGEPSAVVLEHHSSEALDEPAPSTNGKRRAKAGV